ncbi:hypothetical protein ELJ36_28010, partial [Klebsiella pneumoniae]|nr:hypothetical protein [Klebsiella pneumoniae]
SAQIREILISESAWEEMTCLFAPSLDAVWPRRVKMVTLVCPVCLFAESSFSDNAMISSKVCPFLH